MQTSYEIQFLKALALTILIELPLLWIVVRKLFREKKPAAFLLFTGLTANLSPLPLAWFLFPAFLKQAPYVMVTEIFAVLFETAAYGIILKIPTKKAFMVSLGCNAFSFLLGLVILPKL